MKNGIHSPQNDHGNLESFLKVFGLKRDYEAIVDLVNRLIDIAPLVRVSDFPDFDMGLWDKILFDLLEELRLLGKEPRGGTTYRGNAAGGIFDHSQLCAAILASLDNKKYEDRYTGLVALMSVRAFSDVQVGLKKWKKESETIRTKLTLNRVSDEVLEQFPDFNFKTATRYYLRLFQVVEKLKLERVNLDNEDWKFVKAVDSFISGIRPVKRRVRFQEDLPSFEDESTSVPISEDEDFEVAFLAGKVTQTNQKVSTGQDEEAPEKTHSYNEKLTGDEYIDDRVFEINAKVARYWLAKTESLSRISRTSLNDIERRELVSYLQSNINSSDQEESLISAIIGLVYTTGRSVNILANAYVGEDGVFQGEGNFICILPKKPIVYRVEVGDKEVRSIYVPLPPILKQWFQDNKKILVEKGSISTAFSIKTKDLLKKVKKKLKSLRQNGKYKIKLPRLESAIPFEVTLGFRDPVLTAVFAGNVIKNLPVLGFYRAVSEPEVKDVYKRISSKLFEQPYQDVLITLGEPVPDTIKIFIEKITYETEKVLKAKSADIVETHNVMVMFTWAMMHFSSGHRPVLDPMCYVKDINMQEPMMLISDKVISDRYLNRLIYLPEIAIQQLKAYATHLKRLARKALNAPSVQANKFGKAIFNMLEGCGAQKIPFLFLLDSLDKPTRSINKTEIEAYWNKFESIPSNAGRAILATELTRRKISSPLIETQLGHLEGVSHPWGPRSERIPDRDGEKLAPTINKLMIDLGWKVLKSSEYEAKNNKNEYRVDGQVHSDGIFGPEKRKLARQMVADQRIRLVKNAIEEQAFPEGAKYISKEQVRKLEEDVKELAETQKIGYESCIRLVRRWLRMKTRQGIKVESLTRGFVLAQEPSPISQEIFCKRRDLKLLKEGFTNYLNNEGKEEKELTIEKRVAEIILSAALFDNIYQKDDLKNIIDILVKDVYRIGPGLFARLPSCWWIPSELTKSLITGLYKLNIVKKPDGRSVARELRRLQKILFGKNDKKGMYEWMSSVSSVEANFMYPGFIRSVMLNERPAMSLSVNVIQRLQTGQSLVLGKMNEKDKETITDWTPDLREFDEYIGADDLVKKIGELFSNVKKEEAKGRNNDPYVQAKELKKEVVDFVNDTSGLTQITVALCSWLTYRCDIGKSGSELRINSLRRYESELFRPLINLFKNTNLFALGPEEYEYLYRKALDWKGRKDKEFRINRIYDFHEFLSEVYAIEEPEWSGLFAYAKANQPKRNIDANLITEVEYFRCLEIIDKDNNLTSLEKDRYAMTLILGYRFGLRFGEVMRMKFRDLQVENNKIFVQVTNGVYGLVKTNSGLRQIPLVGELRESELRLVEKIMMQSEYLFDEDIQVLLLHMGESREEVENYRIAKYLNDLLKFVTGDSSVRFHHCRHGWVNRMIAIAYPEGHSGIWKLVREKLIGKSGSKNSNLLWGTSEAEANRIRAISDAVGHANESTTLSSYFHFHDFLSLSIRQKYKEQIKLHGYCYILAENYGTLNGRNNNNQLFTLHERVMKAEKIHKIFKELHVEVQSYDRLQVFDSKEGKEQSISLNMIDRFLTVLSNRSGNTDRLEEVFNISKSQKNELVVIASEVERRSGYENYRLALTEKDLLFQESKISIKKPRDNRDETKRFRIFSTNIERTISGHKYGDNLKVLQAMEIWTNAYQPETNNYVFTSIEELKQFIEVLECINIKEYRAELKHANTDNWSEKIYAELTRMKIVVKTVNYKVKTYEKTSARRITNLVIGFYCISENIKTTYGLNRLFFCLLILFRLRFVNVSLAK